MEIENYTIPRVIGVKQAAAEFGIAEHALRAWIRAGRLPAIQCGRKHLINCTVLSRFLSGCVTAQDDSRFSSSEPDTLSPRGERVVCPTKAEREHGTGSLPAAAIGADGTLYTKAPGKTVRNGKGRLYKIMPAIR